LPDSRLSEALERGWKIEFSRNAIVAERVIPANSRLQRPGALQRIEVERLDMSACLDHLLDEIAAYDTPAELAA
jgi:hypothetical protein